MSTEAASVGQLMDSVLIKITRLEDSSDRIIDYRRRPRSPLKWNWEKATARLQSPASWIECGNFEKRHQKWGWNQWNTASKPKHFHLFITGKPLFTACVCVWGACVLYVCVCFLSLWNDRSWSQLRLAVHLQTTSWSHFHIQSGPQT